MDDARSESPAATGEPGAPAAVRPGDRPVGPAARLGDLVLTTLLGGAGLLVLVALSVPGLMLGPLVLALGALVVTVPLGAVRIIRILRSPGPRRRRTAALAIGLVAIALWLGLLVTRAPLTVRWASARGAFDAQVRRPELIACGAGHQVDVPTRIGGYAIIAAECVAHGVVFDEGNGSGLLDDAGFAYLPQGIDEDDLSLENPQFRSLGGGWYAWTATW